jgi:hypothetical protein
LWLGSLDNEGYGRACRGAKAHRLAYEREIGPIGDLHVLHMCDNRRCVRPDHLFLGTQSDNSKDMWQKNRAYIAKGAESSNAKLTDEAIRQIRLSLETSRALAVRHGVSKTAINYVRTWKTWRHVQ